MIYHGDNYHFCLECKRVFIFGDIVIQGKWGYYCQKCPERKPMTNIKITAEVNGKQVPLETISTETFEAIKALEKPKEIPVARVGNYTGYPSDRRLFLIVSDHLREVITNQKDIKMVAIELTKGAVNNSWSDINKDLEDLYENVQPL